MRKPAKPKLPPIAVDDRTEKLSITVPIGLKRDMEQFGAFFTDTTGHRPTSFNAVAVGIMVGYLNSHTSFQKWLKAQGRAFARTETIVSS
jgi:hypothetical protein